MKLAAVLMMLTLFIVKMAWGTVLVSSFVSRPHGGGPMRMREKLLIALSLMSIALLGGIWLIARTF